MIEWIFWIVASLWMAEALAAAVMIRRFLPRMERQETAWTVDEPMAVAVILPVKGFDPEMTPEFFTAILGQDYPRYRLLLAVESEDDPVVPWLAETQGITARAVAGSSKASSASGLSEVKLVVAGPCEGRGQKVHNQLAAFESLQPDDEIVVFADADMNCGTDWLAKLVAPINAGTHAVATTYRWLVPRGGNPANRLASVINASVATSGGDERWNLLWGGSMAIRRSVFDELDVPDHLAGSVNDDLRLTKLVRPAGHRPAFVHSLVVPSPIDFDGAKLWEFGHRQYVQVRHFGPIIYRASLAVTGLYTIGFLGSVAGLIAGVALAWVPLVFVALCDQFRAWERRRIVRRLFDEETQAAIAKTALLEHCGTPLWMGLHWLMALSALFTDRLRWAGIEYRIVSRSETEVLGRSGES